jgi:lysozyme
MNLSPAGAAFVRHHEGFVPSWYLDPVQVPTIGVGFTWLSSSFREWWGKNKPGKPFAKGATMTQAEADACLQFMVEREYGAAVNKFLGKTVPQHVFDGTVSPVYNLGPGSLEWKWAAAVKAGEYRRAAELLRSTGTTAKGKRLPGLVTRRKEEAELIELGDYRMGTAVAEPMADGMLVKGERGAEVADLQQRLAELGIYDGKVDGIFGFGTEKAVLDFQRAHGLKADGFAGPKTLQALKLKPPIPDVPTYPQPIPTSGPAKSRKGIPAWVYFAALVVAVLIGMAVFTPLF